MRLEPVCAFDLHYTSDFTRPPPIPQQGPDSSPYGRARCTGPRRSGAAQWSNQPTRRGAGVISAETMTMHLDVFECLSEI